MNGQSDLIIENPIAEQHNGRLTVVAENKKGSTESSAEIRIQPAVQSSNLNLKKPEFSKKPQDHEIVVGEESVKFSAIINATPAPQVSWYLNDINVKSIENVNVKFEPESGKTSIRIYNPKIEQVSF